MEELFFGIDKLPMPLDNNETIELFIKYHSGDMQARAKLIKHNIRLALFVVRNQIGETKYEKKDLVALGIEGLINAVDNYDIKMKRYFSTYATTCIRNSIYKFLKNEQKKVETESIERIERSYKDDEEIHYFTTESRLMANYDVAAIYECKELYERIMYLIDRIDDKRDSEIIKLHFGLYGNKKYTIVELASMYNCSTQNISKVIIKRLNELKNNLIEEGLINIKKGRVKQKRHYKTIYENFCKFGMEEINEMLKKLTLDEVELLTLRYGEDLTKPHEPIWSEAEKNKYYNNLQPKMKKLLENPSKEINFKKKRKYTIVPSDSWKKLFNEAKSIENFREIILGLKKENFVVISLFLGLIDENYYSIPSIGRLLNIPDEKIISIIKDFIDSLKDYSSWFEDLSKIDLETFKERYNLNFPKNKNLKFAKYKTIYENFANYKKEEIDEALKKLSKDEIELIHKRYGDDLTVPNKPTWNSIERSRFYNYLHPKMNKILENPGIVCKPSYVQKFIGTPNSETIDLYNKIVSNPNFNTVFYNLPINTKVIVILKFGLIDDKYFKTHQIANFLSVGDEEILCQIRNFVLQFSKEIDKNMIKAIKF